MRYPMASRSYLAMQHGRSRRVDAVESPLLSGVAIPHFAMRQARKFWSQFPACGAAGACGYTSAAVAMVGVALGMSVGMVGVGGSCVWTS
jgi:hypothetical protein